MVPVQDFQCLNCGHVTELFLKSATDSCEEKCESCGEDKLNKLISSPSFQLKGSGWYETDFKNKSSSDRKSSTDSDNKEIT